ncbi:hypothetical protein [Coraliomargarita akajimensis]|uniref:Outer membrane protein beta-barrel domain-containing protein n=1 Tax=Coraliomargarita akajimensis (strain DSM 45221 / IAM 15411 / JCM 23193 / KCTC 12865 / 04OKA010-24) TaxID=583355 RepID=D5ER47_CORAD|nr:hypothetical protein [Coraliomargarita akajimensis]ADE55891.1 hypothetical protein Caka_2878 [Coraliomargarita akajimensis DSM 45221]
MKTTILLISSLALASASSLSAAIINNRATAYASYWSASGANDGYGAGLKYSKQFAGFVMGDVRGSYYTFDASSTSVVPLEASINLYLPAFISPYAGVGAGYYFVDSSKPDFENSSGYFAQIGADMELFGLGVFGELRYIDAERVFLDGVTANIGISLKF